MYGLCKRIAAGIGAQMGYDDEKIAVVAYGMLALFQTLMYLIYTVVFGLLTGTLIPALLVNFAGGLLRSVSGGAHSGSLLLCTILGFTVIASGSVLSVYALSALDPWICAAVWLSAFAWFFAAAVRYVPVDAPGKPIRRPEKIRRLRRQTFGLLAVLAALCLGCVVWSHTFRNRFALSLFWALLSACAWQIWTLTPAGRRFVAFLDRLLGQSS